MRYLIFILVLFFSLPSISWTQETPKESHIDRHQVIWSAGLFKSWLKDAYVGFNKIGDQVSPVFTEEKKMGFSFKSHYVFKPKKWLGLGIHLGVGLDVYSYPQAPVVLFGGSIALGDHLILDIGWADGKRKIVPNAIRDALTTQTYTEIPTLHEYTELNTAYYLGISYRLF